MAKNIFGCLLICFLCAVMVLGAPVSKDPSYTYVGTPIPEDCGAVYQCYHRDPSRNECIKYRVTQFSCPNGSVEVEDTFVEVHPDPQPTTEVNAKNPAPHPGTESYKPVALIDFPCQSGFRPDRKGKCRRVW